MFLGVCPPGLMKSFLWFSSLRLLLSASSSLMGTDAFEDAIEGDWNLKSAVIDGELVGVLRDDWTTRWNRGVLALSPTVFELLLSIKASIAGSFLPANQRWCHQAIGIATNGGFPLPNAKWPKISPPSWPPYLSMTAAQSEICSVLIIYLVAYCFFLPKMLRSPEDKPLELGSIIDIDRV